MLASVTAAAASVVQARQCGARHAASWMAMNDFHVDR
jgi:hypothetical protein